MEFLNATYVNGRGNILVISDDFIDDKKIGDILTFEITGIESFGSSNKVGLILKQMCD